MSSCSNATIPAATNSSKPNTTIARRLRQKATRALNIARGGRLALTLVAGRRVQHVAEKNAARGHGQFAALQTGEDLIVAIAQLPERQRSLHKATPIGGHPDDH